MPQYVVRAGLARPDDLIRGTAMHRSVPGRFGFSVQSRPGIAVEELARGARFPHLQISVITLEELRGHGFDLVFPTPGSGAYHATVRVPQPFSLADAIRLHQSFHRRPNPWPIPERKWQLMFRIWFDENEGDEQDRYDLGIPGSLADIEPIADQLSDGMHVILYEDGSLEVEAVLEWEPKYHQWMARPLWDTLRRFELPENPAAAAR